MTPEEATTLLKAGWIPTRLDSSARPSFSFEDVKQIIELIESLQSENAELKAKLENAICPKFKIGQEVWFCSERADEVIYCGEIEEITIGKHYGSSIQAIYETTRLAFRVFEDEIFLTEQEALESLKNEGE